MNGLLSLVLLGLAGQIGECPVDAFVENILLPMNTSQKGHAGLGMDREGNIIALTYRTCSDLERCKDQFRGRLLDCRNRVVGESFPAIDYQFYRGPAVAKAPGGDLFVVWATETCVLGRAFDRDGRPLSDELVLAPDRCFNPVRPWYFPQVVTSIGAEESYVAAWGEQVVANDTVTTFKVRKYDHLGAWANREFLIDRTAYPDIVPQRNLASVQSITVSEAGEIYLLTLHANLGGPKAYALSTPIVWRLTPELELIGEPIVITRADYFHGGDIGVDRVGNFVASWRHPGEGWLERDEPLLEELVFQRFTPDGVRVGDRVRVTPEPTPFTSHIGNSKIIMRPDGQFIVMWAWFKQGGIVGQRYTADGAKVGRTFQVNVSVPAYNPMVASNRGDYWAVFYMIGSDAAGPEPHTVATRVFNFDATAFIRGDANDNDVLDLSDAIFILDYLFQAGAPPPAWHAADVNDDQTVNISDPVYLLIHLFRGGAPPPYPYPLPGFDPTD